MKTRQYWSVFIKVSGHHGECCLKYPALLLQWCEEKKVQEIFLGTTLQFLAAHRFYEKDRFTEISPADLPQSFPVMAVDKRFYKRKI
ncbi:hypothetical protein [Hahella chejuensis]|uniref:hypothetical protein n=1 Tax=Hahella chejuensis TaxID=158327 RepID=UPI0013052194|nr:hypothetical protein [Hahella chejuensis]